jgi:hypothetical protein
MVFVFPFMILGFLISLKFEKQETTGFMQVAAVRCLDGHMLGLFEPTQ